jgi:hypothetical protein
MAQRAFQCLWNIHPRDDTSAAQAGKRNLHCRCVNLCKEKRDASALVQSLPPTHAMAQAIAPLLFA